MKGIVLAGGLGTRLYPLTYATNKHLLPVYNQPMAYYPIKTLVKAGIKEIMVVVSGPHSGHFLSVLKNGKQLGVDHLEYAYQEKPNGGIADALAVCEDFADNDNVTVILGDNTTDANISKNVKNFKKGAMIFLKKFHDQQKLKKLGVAVFNQKDPSKIKEIEEKPKKPKSKFCVTGLYIYDNKVFNYIKKCKPSKRGELEITDVNNFYIRAGNMRWAELKDFWSDAGSFEALFRANLYWAKKAGWEKEVF